MEEDYLGVPSEYVFELGKIVVSAGKVEQKAHDILECLALDGMRSTVAWDDLKKAARKQLTKGVPQCTTGIDAEEILDWFTRAKAATAARSQLFHAAHFQMGSAGELVSMTEYIRKRAARPVDVTDARKVREDLAAVARSAVEIVGRLLHPVAGGAMANCFVQRDSEAISPEVAAQFQKARDQYPACPWVTGVFP